MIFFMEQGRGKPGRIEDISGVEGRGCGRSCRVKFGLELVFLVTRNISMETGQRLVTMKDLAVKLRMSKMTVSRALRNAAGVHVKTRKRVVEMAAQMNYRPDPTLGVLNMYRHGRRSMAVAEKIAFVTNFPTADGWKHSITFVRYFEGLRKRARVLGYEVDPFWLGAPGLSGHRSSSILHGRGIRGLIVGPLMQGHSALELNWDLFSAVALGRSLQKPAVSTVSANHFQAMELACTEVARRGYHRPGYAVTLGEEARTTGVQRAAFRMKQEQSPGPVIPPLVVAEFSSDEIAAWAEKYQPDVLISSEQTHFELLRARLKRRAEAISFVHLNVDPASEVGGVDQRHDLVGEKAAALLHLKLLQRETGVPDPQELLLVNCGWKEGRGRWALRRLTRR